MRLASQLLDRVLYGYISDPHLIKVVAVVGNYSLSMFFWDRCDRPVAALLGVLAATAFMYTKFPAAVGVSTVWSFLYGFQSPHSPASHLAFATPCAVMALPWLRMDGWTRRHFGFRLWPWKPEFIGIAHAAHVSFALLGCASRRVCMT